MKILKNIGLYEIIDNLQNNEKPVQSWSEQVFEFKRWAWSFQPAKMLPTRSGGEQELYKW